MKYLVVYVKKMSFDYFVVDNRDYSRDNGNKINFLFEPKVNIHHFVSYHHHFKHWNDADHQLK